MAVTINGTSGVTFPAGGVGNPAGTVVGTSDSQTLTSKTLTSPTMTTPTIDSAQIPTVSGTAPIYMCRAWAKWSGVTTVTVNGSGNISSITRGSTGTYTVNFTTAISDANYSIGSAIGTGDNNNPYTMNISASPTTSAFTLTVNRAGLTGLYDSSLICIQVFR